MTLRANLPQRADRLLTILIVGVLAAPIAAGVVGVPLATPFALSLWGLGLLLAGVLAAHVAIGTLFRSRRELLVEVALAATLTLAFALLVRAHANAFYTARALFEGFAALLTLNLVARLGQRLARHADGPMRPAAPALADHIVVAALWLTAAVIVFAALGIHEAAGASLVLATALHLPPILLRMPAALQGLVVMTRRSRRGARVRYHLARRRLRNRRRRVARAIASGRR